MVDLSGFRNPQQIQKDIALRMVRRRKGMKISQEELSLRSSVSLGSIRRFERTGEISLASLVKIGFALDSVSDFSGLFERKGYSSIEEIINEDR